MFDKEIVAVISRGIELSGVIILVLGLLTATLRFIFRGVHPRAKTSLPISNTRRDHGTRNPAWPRSSGRGARAGSTPILVLARLKATLTFSFSGTSESEDISTYQRYRRDMRTRNPAWPRSSGRGRHHLDCNDLTDARKRLRSCDHRPRSNVPQLQHKGKSAKLQKNTREVVSRRPGNRALAQVPAQHKT